MPETNDFRGYDETTLTLLADLMPAWRAAIDAERTRRAAEIALWNDPRALRKRLKQEMAYRWVCGYSANEEARGVDEVESDRWQELQRRIRELVRQRRNERARARRRTKRTSR